MVCFVSASALPLCFPMRLRSLYRIRVFHAGELTRLHPRRRTAGESQKLQSKERERGIIYSTALSALFMLQLPYPSPVVLRSTTVRHIQGRAGGDDRVMLMTQTEPMTDVSAVPRQVSGNEQHGGRETGTALFACASNLVGGSSWHEFAGANRHGPAATGHLGRLKLRCLTKSAAGACDKPIPCAAEGPGMCV